MMSIVALYLPWCRYLAAQEGVQPQLYADNLKCVSRGPGVLLRLLGSLLGMSGWLVRNPPPASVCAHEYVQNCAETHAVLGCDG